MRATPARLAVLAVIASSAHPLSHADIVQRIPAEHDRTTIFRVLAALLRARLLRRFDAGDRVWRYQHVARAPSDALAAVFVCTACERVTELSGLQLAGPRTLPRSLARHEVEVTVRGVCDECA